MFIEIVCSHNTDGDKPRIFNMSNIVQVEEFEGVTEIIVGTSKGQEFYYTKESYESLKKTLLDLKF